MTMTDDELADVLGQSQDSPGTPDEEAQSHYFHPEAEEEPPAVVVVVGSFHWDSPGSVTDQLEAWRVDRQPHRVMLITSGCPQGAERVAREYAGLHGWQQQQMRDEELVQLPTAIAFLFVKDESAGATRALEIIEQAKIWHRVTRDSTVRMVSPWADR
jgi:hypothetical protein